MHIVLKSSCAPRRLIIDNSLNIMDREYLLWEQYVTENPELHAVGFEKIPESWRDDLSDIFRSKDFLNICKFVEEERKRKDFKIFPEANDVFSWTQYCSPKEVKVVIVGQDPFPNEKACGLAFSVKDKRIKKPVLTQHIFKALMNDLGEEFKEPHHANLEGWAKQGVLLLNAVLTVREDKCNSHAGIGWEKFTDDVIRCISDNCLGVVFLLWGKSAQEKQHMIDKSKHNVLESTSPTSLNTQYHNCLDSFLQCHHFSKANKCLIDLRNDDKRLSEEEKKGIDWTLTAAREAPAQTVNNYYNVNAGVFYRGDYGTAHVADYEMTIGGSHVNEHRAAREVPAQIVNNYYIINKAVIYNHGTAHVVDSNMTIGGSHFTEHRDLKTVEVALAPKAIKRKNTSPLQPPLKMTAEQASSQREPVEATQEMPEVTKEVEVTLEPIVVEEPAANGGQIEEPVKEEPKEEAAATTEEPKIEETEQMETTEGGEKTEEQAGASAPAKKVTNKGKKWGQNKKRKRETEKVSRNKESAKVEEEERLEDVFQDEIIKAIPDITSFKRFARMKKGLCLDDHILKQIVEDHASNMEDQKLQMLNKWREITGEKATVSKIRYLLRRYLRGDEGDYVVLANGMFGMYKNHVLCERARVYLGEQTSEVTGSYICAIKLKLNNKKNLREAKIMSKLRKHVNVVSILHAGIYRSDLNDCIFIAMELSWTDTVRNMLEESDRLGIPFNEFISMNLVKQILSALNFIHSYDIIHRDLKPENVLLSRDWKHSKVTDFGISKTISDGHSTRQTNANIGTEGYRAVETYHANADISLKADIFSAGVTIAEISSNGKHPFGDNPDLWAYNIKNNMNLDLSHLLVPQIMNLIKRMLEVDPEKRPSAKDVLNEVQQFQNLSPTKNQQTTVAQSSATSSRMQLHQSTVKTVWTKVQQFKAWLEPKNPQTTADQCSASAPMAELSIKEKANTIIVFDWSDKLVYSFKAKKWSPMQKCDIDRFFITPVVSGRYMYMLQIREVYQLEYSDSTAKWKQIASMREDHGECPSVAVLNGSIYVCGASGLTDANKSVERYDAGLDQWDLIRDMNIERTYSCVYATKGSIFVCGGGLSDTSESVERYDAASCQWDLIRDENFAITYSCVFATKDHIYCIGGRDTLDHLSVERFDERSKKWKFVRPLPRSIHEASVAVAKNRIYVADHEGVLCYDIQIDSWSKMETKEWSFVKGWLVKIVAVNEELYVIGRIPESSFNTAIYLLEPETGQMTLIEKFNSKKINLLILSNWLK